MESPWLDYKQPHAKAPQERSQYFEQVLGILLPHLTTTLTIRRGRPQINYRKQRMAAAHLMGWTRKLSGFQFDTGTALTEVSYL